MRLHVALFSIALTLPLFTFSAKADVTFNTFVSGPSISTVEGQNATIGFAYAGNKFVGSVYFGSTTISCIPLT